MTAVCKVVTTENKQRMVCSRRLRRDSDPCTLNTGLVQSVVDKTGSDANSKQWFTTYFLQLQEAGAGKRCSECGSDAHFKVSSRYTCISTTCGSAECRKREDTRGIVWISSFTVSLHLQQTDVQPGQTKTRPRGRINRSPRQTLTHQVLRRVSG